MSEASNDYPKFMCRAGGSEDCRGVMVEAGSALDAADEKAKLADGWVFAPEDLGKPAPKTSKAS